MKTLDRICQATMADRVTVCRAPAVAVHDYACVHEHVKRGMATCAAHAPEPGVADCLHCWQLGHECDMTAVPAVTP